MGWLPWWLRDKEFSCQCGRTGSIPGLGRRPGEGNGSSFQYSCLENLHVQRSLVGYSPWHQTCVWLFWDPMDWSTLLYPSPSLGACSHLLWVSDAIQPSCPLLSPSPLAFNLAQHQGLFQWVSSLHKVARVLELQLQHQSFQWIFRTDFL